MFWKDVATLVSVKKNTDTDGYTTETPSRRDVFVDVQSVKRSEFYEARKGGIGIAIVFVVRAADYNGETRIEYRHSGDKDATAYNVVRAYTKSGEVYELNCSCEAPADVSEEAADELE